MDRWLRPKRSQIRAGFEGSAPLNTIKRLSAIHRVHRNGMAHFDQGPSCVTSPRFYALFYVCVPNGVFDQ